MATMRGLLKRARWDSGLSQRDLAALLGRSQSWVSKVESGQAGIDPAESLTWIDRCGFRVDGAALAPRDRPLDLLQVAAFQQLPVHQRLRRTLRTLEARGHPLGDVPAEVALARLRRHARAYPGGALGGAVAAACWTPDIGDHPHLPRLAIGPDDGWSVPVRLGRLHRSPQVGLPSIAQLQATGWDTASARTAAAAAGWLRGARLARAHGSNPFASAP